MKSIQGESQPGKRIVNRKLESQLHLCILAALTALAKPMNVRIDEDIDSKNRQYITINSIIRSLLGNSYCHSRTFR